MKTDERARVAERGDATDLVGTAVVRRADGTLVPYLDDDGDEVLGIATGPRQTLNAFCPTGPGGGQDNSCAPSGGGGRSEPSNAEETQLKEMMGTMAGLRRDKPEGHKYSGVDQLVLDNGAFFEPAPLPEGVEMGEPKQCYMNATKLALYSEEYSYVEGSALISKEIPLPIAHAWVVDKEGRVVDNTWSTPGAAYFGVKISQEFLLKQAMRTKVYGVFGGSHRGTTRELLKSGMPKGAVTNAFCPTGAGGGIDNSCSPSGGSGGSRTTAQRLSMTPANPDGIDTSQAYKRPDGTLTPERALLHSHVVAEVLAQSTPVSRPTAYLLGGGPGSGKTTLIKSGKMGLPENLSMIAGDEFKEKLPEFNKGVAARDTGIAQFVHEESTEIAAKALRQASETKRNLVLDGTGDSGIEKLTKKVEQMRAGGQTVEAHYVTIPTETAVARAEIRMQKTGRGVPRSVIEENHAAVSAVFPIALSRGLFDRATLWDNSEKEHDPVEVLRHERGKTTVLRPDLYQRFLRKNPEYKE